MRLITALRNAAELLVAKGYGDGRVYHDLAAAVACIEESDTVSMTTKLSGDDYENAVIPVPEELKAATR